MNCWVFGYIFDSAEGLRTYAQQVDEKFVFCNSLRNSVVAFISSEPNSSKFKQIKNWIKKLRFLDWITRINDICWDAAVAISCVWLETTVVQIFGFLYYLHLISNSVTNSLAHQTEIFVAFSCICRLINAEPHNHLIFTYRNMQKYLSSQFIVE